MPGPSSLIAKVTAPLFAIAGVIHLVLTPEHFKAHVLYGVFFLGAATVQLLLAGALVLGSRSRMRLPPARVRCSA